MSDIDIMIQEAREQGFIDGWDELASRIEKVIDDPNIAIYHLTDRIREVLHHGE